MEELVEVESRGMGGVIYRSEPVPVEDLVPPATSTGGVDERVKIVRNGIQ